MSNINIGDLSDTCERYLHSAGSRCKQPLDHQPPCRPEAQENG